MTSHPSLPHKAGDAVMVRYRSHPHPDGWMRAEVVAVYLYSAVKEPTLRYRVRYPDSPGSLHNAYDPCNVRFLGADDLKTELAQ